MSPWLEWKLEDDDMMRGLSDWANILEIRRVLRKDFENMDNR